MEIIFLWDRIYESSFKMTHFLNIITSRNNLQPSIKQQLIKVKSRKNIKVKSGKKKLRLLKIRVNLEPHIKVTYTTPHESYHVHILESYHGYKKLGTPLSPRGLSS